MGADSDQFSANPRDWRPLEARLKARNPIVTDPIIEPFWQGTRVLAHFKSTPNDDRPGTVMLIDADGFDVTREFADVARATERAVAAQDAVIDGILTDQAMASAEGVGVVTEAKMNMMGVMFGRAGEVEVTTSRDRERGSEVAFVALDLLSVDGERLFDLPLLERKRLLEGIVIGNELARVSPFARPPVAQWLNSWKSAGFNGVVMRAANSRYRSSDATSAWAVVERISGR